jgi:bifunctional DNase/RNase
MIFAPAEVASSADHRAGPTHYASPMVDLELIGVRIEVVGNTPVIILRERDGDRRVLPIYIGKPEASSIQWAIDGLQSPRPLTHDLIVDLLGALGAVLESVVITDVDEGVFLAELVLQSRTGIVRVSCRPSDAVAVAVRTGAHIQCSRDVIDEAGKYADLGDESGDEGEDQLDGEFDEQNEESELLGEFRDFIENINPDDFKP